MHSWTYDIGRSHHTRVGNRGGLFHQSYFKIGLNDPNPCDDVRTIDESSIRQSLLEGFRRSGWKLPHFESDPTVREVRFLEKIDDGVVANFTDASGWRITTEV